MAPNRRQRTLLIALGVVLLAAGVWWTWLRTPPAASGRGASNARGPAAKASAAQMTAPEVHLGALQEERPKPEELSRNLFRFKPKPAPPPPAPVQQAQRSLPPPPPSMVPSGPPPVPPIPLKFSAILTQGPDRVAVLVDTFGHVIYGREGGTVEGRYKIWRIGVESIEMSYLDGQGRQTIRLSGQ
ncbi:MAG TPA: hypothetical protein VJP86_16745 [Vicinamibacterales bacterium]|jgi:hypothetical protein|nr:hypothetical protein [Vicinamibacterales bacterium]